MDTSGGINVESERLPLKWKGTESGKKKVNTIEDSFSKAVQGKKNRSGNNGLDGKKEENEDQISVKVKKEMLDDEVVDLGSHNCQMVNQDLTQVKFTLLKILTMKLKMEKPKGR